MSNLILVFCSGLRCYSQLNESCEVDLATTSQTVTLTSASSLIDRDKGELSANWTNADSPFSAHSVSSKSWMAEWRTDKLCEPEKCIKFSSTQVSALLVVCYSACTLI